MRIFTIKVLTIIVLFCTSIHAQLLYKNEIITAPSSVSLSSDGSFAVFTDDKAEAGIVIHRVSDWSVYSRVGQVGRDIGQQAMTTYGFLNDSVIVVNGSLNSLSFYNFHTDTIIDSVLNASFSTWMSPNSVLISRDLGGDSAAYYEYNIVTHIERFVFRDYRNARIYSTSRSPYYIRWIGDGQPVVYTKNNDAAVAELGSSRDAYVRHPFSFTDDGLSVYALSNNRTISKYSLADGIVEKKISLPRQVDASVDVYVNPQENLISYTSFSSSGASTMEVMDSNGTSLQYLEDEPADEYRYFSWQKQGSKYFLSTIHYILEFDAMSNTYWSVKAIRRYIPKLFTICSGSVSVVASNDDNPLYINLITGDVRYIVSNNPLMPISISYRLEHSDSLFFPGFSYELFLLDFCSDNWQTIPFTYDIDMSTACISYDRNWIAGVTKDGQNVRIVNLSTGQQKVVTSTEVGSPLRIRIADLDSSVILFGDDGALIIDLSTGNKRLYAQINTTGYIQSRTNTVIDRYGKSCVILQDYRLARIYRSFPNDSVDIGLFDAVKLNTFLSVSVNDDGTLVSLAEETGLVRILDTKTLAERARIRLQGFAPYYNSIEPYIWYNPDTRILESVNLYGELTIQRWPDNIVSVETEQSTPIVNNHKIVAINNEVQLPVPVAGKLLSINFYDSIGRQLSAENEPNVRLSSNAIELEFRESGRGVVFCIVQSENNIYTYCILLH